VFAQAIAGIVMRGFAELNKARGMVQGNFSTIMKIQQALEREPNPGAQNKGHRKQRNATA
jgi:hypothetical protein